MQKVLSLILAVALMLSLSITAFASGQGGSKDVTAKYQKTTGEETIYNVDIACAMESFSLKAWTRCGSSAAMPTYCIKSYSLERLRR